MRVNIDVPTFMVNLKEQMEQSVLSKNDFRTNTLRTLYAEVERSGRVESAIGALLNSNEEAIDQFTSLKSITDVLKKRVEELEKQNEIYSEFLPKKLTEPELVQVLKDNNHYSIVGNKDKEQIIIDFCKEHDLVLRTNNLHSFVGTNDKKNADVIIDFCKDSGLNIYGKVAKKLVAGE